MDRHYQSIRHALTMEHATPVVANAKLTLAHSGDLLTTLSTSLHSFLQPTSSLQSDALAYVKAIFDPLATNVATAQKLRRDENRRKRKRGDLERDDDVLQLRQVYTNGLGVKQVWEQARRVLDAACTEIERDITAQKVGQRSDSEDHVATHGHNRHASDASNASDEDIDAAEDSDLADDMLEDDLLDESDIDEDDKEGMEEFDDAEYIEEDDPESDPDQQDPGTYVQDPNKLNDGFFSIDNFNKQTQFLEQQDARGDDDNPSDEDEIDWDADPSTTAFRKPQATSGDQNSKAEGTIDADEESDEEDGPTFGDADLNADDIDEDMLDQDDDALNEGFAGLDNTNEVRYSDFFAPPPKKLSKTKRMRALPKTQPTAQTPAEDDDLENRLQRAISDVRRDLLESEDEESDMGSGSDVDDTRQSMKNMSTHEKQRAVIAAEIRRLEAASVAKRDWTLSGEARAAERPLNSLIEEDMEFERVGKPVPVITAEVSEEMEQLIKRRIVAREFDEIVRRHPDAASGAGEARRGRIDLDDTKSQSGLAEIYEQEHLKATDPGYVDKRSAATKKQHEEISRLWKEVSSQLDLLSNLHFKPKRVEIDIKMVADKPTISMEDARPVGVGVNAEESMLAPQEVYRPGEETRKGGDMVVQKSGASVSKDEMSREEKLRKRRREKERTKKAQGNSSVSGAITAAGARDGNPKKSKSKGKEQEKADILSDLRKGNVKVIGKKGELQDLGGKKGQAGVNVGVVAGGAYKL